MKKLMLFGLVAMLSIALVGCQSKSSTDTDDAQVGPQDQQTSDVAAPPVPPVPTRPAN